MAVLGKPQLKVVAIEDLKVPPATRKTVIQPVRSDTFNSHPATGLTVEMLLSFYRSAERGVPVRQYDCFDDLIEVDAHLRSLHEGNIESVAGCDFVMQAGRADKASELAAAALDERLRYHVGFNEFLEHHLMAPDYGMSATNIVWDVVDGLIAPCEFINGAHRRFASPTAERADEIWLYGGDTSRDLILLEPGLWAVSRARGRNPWAAGRMRTASFWAMFKRWGFRDWMTFAEMFGLPLALGYYEEGASLPARAALEAAVKSIGEDGWAILSNLTEIVVKETARSGDSSSLYPLIVETCEAQLTKLFTGGTLNTDVGAKGSYAAGTIHESRQYKKDRAAARRLETMVSRDVGVPFIAWNGFDRAAPPRMKIQITRDSLERAQALEIVGQAIDLDEDQMREEFSLRKPGPGKGVRFPSKTTGATSKPPGAPNGP
jgi:phage gp29-like protein